MMPAGARAYLGVPRTVVRCHETEDYVARVDQLLRLRLRASFRPSVPLLTVPECDRELGRLRPPRRRRR